MALPCLGPRLGPHRSSKVLCHQHIACCKQKLLALWGAWLPAACWLVLSCSHPLKARCRLKPVQMPHCSCRRL